jgi:hypothetical protein
MKDGATLIGLQSGMFTVMNRPNHQAIDYQDLMILMRRLMFVMLGE